MVTPNSSSIKIYVINLDRRPDRLAEMTERLNALGLEFERVSAFDGHKQSILWKVAWFKAYVVAGFEKPPRGQVGCYLSHRSVWQKIVSKNEKQAFVLEDDAFPVDWDPNILAVILEEHELDLLRLEGGELSKYTGQWIEGVNFETKEYKFANRIATNEFSYRTAAYIVSLSGAKKMLSVGKYWFPVDDIGIWTCLTGIRASVLKQPMWKQSISQSDIDIGNHASPKPYSSFAELMWRIRRPFIRFYRRQLASYLKWLIRNARVS